MMKKLLAVTLSLIMVLGLLAGCGGSNSGSGSDSGAPAGDAQQSGGETQPSGDGGAADYSDLKIALLLSGSAKDGGWSQMAADAANAVADQYGCMVNYSESLAATDFETTIRGYAEADYDIIVTHGAEFLDAAKLVAKDYQDITFVATSAREGQEPNLAGIDFDTTQLGFLVGAACAMATETKKIGAIGSNEVDSLVLWADAVEMGAKYIDPECEVLRVFTGSYDDALKAKQAVDALYERGCDTITQDADACGNGAVQESADLDLYNVGCVTDQCSLGDTCFISILQDAQHGIEVAIGRAIEGTLGSGAVYLGANAGVISLTEYSGKYADLLTDEEKATLQDLWQQTYDGVDLTTLVN